MANTSFFVKVEVTDSNWPASPQIDFGFTTSAFSLLNLDGSTTVEYSFDGSTLHGDLEPGTSSAGLVFDNRLEDSIYLRAASNAKGADRN